MKFEDFYAVLLKNSSYIVVLMELLSGTHSKLGTPKDMGDLAVLVKEGDVKSDLIKPEKEDFVNSDVGLTNGSGIGFPPGTGTCRNDITISLACDLCILLLSKTLV